MEKVGIITIYDENNYGNRLQNYAVQTILEKMGFEVKTLKNINIVDGINYLEEAEKVDYSRRKNFLEFNKNIKVSEDVIYHDKVPENLHEEFDYFVIGSDQIWNHNFPDRFSDFVFADFAPSDKIVAFSASFGISEIEIDHIEKYDKIKNVKNISVREEAGKQILEKHFGILDAEHLIDPTLMLSADEWRKVSKRPEELKDEKYIFKYFLGPISEEKNKEILKFAEENHYKIIDVMDKDGEHYATGPSEFLYLIENSEAVFTDSFHSCVFSIIFNKPFLYFPREGNLKNINSRLDSLFKKFNISGKTFEGKIDNNCLKFDNSSIKEIITNEQDRAINFLNKALGKEVVL